MAEQRATNITWHEGSVTREERQQLLNQQGVTVWMTGLSASGKSVLLVERGPISSGYWGGNLTAPWLEGTNLTRFDVPGLFNQIWVDPEPVNCEDHEVQAGW